MDHLKLRHEMETLPTADTIQKMFTAYNSATGFDVPFNAVWERNLYESARMGMTPEMITLVIKDRMKGIQRGDRKPASLMPRNLFVGEDIICEAVVEAHALMALKRKIVDASRASVLRATGRPDDFAGVSRGKEIAPQQDTAKPASATVDKLIAELRQAAG